MLCFLPVCGLGQVVWDNGNGNNRWATGQNWSTNNVPTSASSVQFNATDDNATVSNIQLRGDRDANSLTFNNVDDSFSIINGTGSQTLTLASGDITRTAGSSGNQSLTFDTLELGGNAAMNIAGTGNLTISADIVNSGGARSLTKSGAGELILSGSNTYSGGTTVTDGTLTLASTSAIRTGTTLTLSGGTLKLNSSASITNLTVTATSTIDFGGANASLNITNLSISASPGVTLNIINWVNATDAFITANWSGATYNTQGVSPMNQVVFSGFTGDNTAWQSIDNRIRPIPEPSTYGALLLGSMTGLMLWRRHRLNRRSA